MSCERIVMAVMVKQTVMEGNVDGDSPKDLKAGKAVIVRWEHRSVIVF